MLTAKRPRERENEVAVNPDERMFLMAVLAGVPSSYAFVSPGKRRDSVGWQTFYQYANVVPTPSTGTYSYVALSNPNLSPDVFALCAIFPKNSPIAPPSIVYTFSFCGVTTTVTYAFINGTNANTYVVPFNSTVSVSPPSSGFQQGAIRTYQLTATCIGTTITSAALSGTISAARVLANTRVGEYYAAPTLVQNALVS